MSNPTNSRLIGYVPGIDGLRALAVLSVMLYHLQPTWLPGGFTGVDIFFVISGYVVSRSLAGVEHGHLGSFTLGFYARRFLRIVPALVVCLAATELLATMFIPQGWLSRHIEPTGMMAFFGISNFTLYASSSAYFGANTEFNPFTHTWSLGVEEQFYVLFPLVWFVWLRHHRRPSTLGRVSRFAVPTLLLFSLLFAVFDSSLNPSRAFYLLPSRFWELAVGAFLYQLHHGGFLLPRTPSASRSFLLSGSALITIALVLSNHRAFPFPWALPAVLGSALAIAGLTYQGEARSRLQRLFEHTLTRYIGRISYPLYLWHWTIYVLMRWTIGLETWDQHLTAVALTVMAAALSYHLVEHPIRSHRRIRAMPSWALVLSGVMVVLAFHQATQGILDRRYRFALTVTAEPGIWNPTPNDFSRINGDPSWKSRQLFVLGDSHAGAYNPLLRLVESKNEVRVHRLSKGGCPVADLWRPQSTLRPDCESVFRRGIRAIEQSAKPGDVVLLASLRSYRLPKTKPRGRARGKGDHALDIDAEQHRSLALAEARTLLRKLKQLQLFVIIDAGKPVFLTDAYRCSDWFNRSNPLCAAGFKVSRKLLLERRDPLMQSMRSLAKEFENVRLWDPFPTLCPGEQCSAFMHGKPLFKDGDHLAWYGNQLLYPEFLTLLSQIWSQST